MESSLANVGPVVKDTESRPVTAIVLVSSCMVAVPSPSPGLGNRHVFSLICVEFASSVLIGSFISSLHTYHRVDDDESQHQLDVAPNGSDEPITGGIVVHDAEMETEHHCALHRFSVWCKSELVRSGRTSHSSTVTDTDGQQVAMRLLTGKGCDGNTFFE